jgi:hypothetical protein
MKAPMLPLRAALQALQVMQPPGGVAEFNDCSKLGLDEERDCSGDQRYFQQWMDVNADGLEDFVIARPPELRGEGTWRLRLNLGNGTFGPEIDTESSAGLQFDSTPGSPDQRLQFRYAGRLPSMDVDSDGRADLLIPSQKPGAQAFALKMCTIKRVHKIGQESVCPSATESSAPTGDEINLAEGAVCAAYSCSPNPDGSDPLPRNASPLGDARGYPYRWQDEDDNILPAFSAYSSHENHAGPGEDNSVYHLAQLKFVQRGPQQFSVEVIETALVSRLNDHYGSADDLFGDGLPISRLQ